MEWARLLNNGSNHGNHSNHAWYLLSNVSAVLSTSGLPSLSILSPTQGNSVCTPQASAMYPWIYWGTDLPKIHTELRLYRTIQIIILLPPTLYGNTGVRIMLLKVT